MRYELITWQLKKRSWHSNFSSSGPHNIGLSHYFQIEHMNGVIKSSIFINNDKYEGIMKGIIIVLSLNKYFVVPLLRVFLVLVNNRLSNFLICKNISCLCSKCLLNYYSFATTLKFVMCVFVCKKFQTENDSFVSIIRRDVIWFASPSSAYYSFFSTGCYICHYCQKCIIVATLMQKRVW